MWGKVWDPRNDEIPLKHNSFKWRKRHSRRPKGRSKADRWRFLLMNPKERNVGMGWRRCSAIKLKSGQSSTQMAKVASRKVWGMIETIDCGEDRLTSMGTDPDRSRYAPSSDEEPPAFRHSRGKESSIVRQCRQTAVALIRSRSVARNVVVRARVSGGI